MQKIKKARYVSPGEAQPASESPLSAELADQSTRDRLKDAYFTAMPYPHVVVDSLCRPEVMRVIRDEITELEATFKETDIFRVYQVQRDLCSLDEYRETLPQLLALRDAIYSPDFRAFVSEVTGCGPLTNKVDCSANFYSQGCHLLCHDDTIGTRRISYIMYFTDPDKEWTHADGGCFEMYTRNDLTAAPQRILPTFNSMCMFRVVPDESFHSVQEVFTTDNTRISIQGWFHAAVEPENKERASRLLLQSVEPSVVLTQNAALGPFVRLAAGPGEDIEAEEDEDAELSPADVAELLEWISPTYLKPASIAQIREQFTTQSTIQLQMFLKNDLASSIRDLTGCADQEDRGYGKQRGAGAAGPCEYGVGETRAGWKAVGPPQLRKYLRWEAGAEANSDVGAAGSVIGDVAHTRMSSPAFRRFLLAITGLRCLAARAQVRRFRPGLDYTCANPSALTLAHRLDATLCLVNDVGAAAAEQWASGDVGGFQAYLPSAQEDDADKAATYDADGDDGGMLQVPASNNTLNLVLHDPGTHKFVKYVNSCAPGSRWDIAAEYEVSPDDVGAEDEGDEGDEGDD